MDKTVFPYPFTDMQLRYALNLKQKRIFGNFSDPGTGKTGAFLLASRLIDSKISIIICPKGVMTSWINGIEEFYPYNSKIYVNDHSLKYSDKIIDLNSKFHNINTFHNINSIGKLSKDIHNYVIINYDKFSHKESSDKILNNLTKNNIPDFIGLDEIHFVKSTILDPKKESNRRQNCYNLRKEVELVNPNIYVTGLTGTPLVNNLTEVRSLIEFLTGKEHSEIGNNLCGANAIEAYKLLTLYGVSSKFIPKNIYNRDIYENNKVIVINANDIYDDIINAESNRCSYLNLEQILISKKLNDKNVQNELTPGTILYFQYVDKLIDEAANICKKLNRTIGFYTGRDTENRNKDLQKFINGEIDILIASKPLSTGVDGLQKRCNKIIMFSYPFTAAEYDQLKARIIRRGCIFDTVNIIHIYCELNYKDLIWCYDKYRYEIIDSKKTIMNIIIDGEIDKLAKINMTKFTNEKIELLKNGYIDYTNTCIDILPKYNDKEYKKSESVIKNIHKKANTSTSEKMHKYFIENPNEWIKYHKQREINKTKWDEDPVDVIAREINERNDDNVIADMGCGLAKLSKIVKSNNKVISVDHYSEDENVIKCDMSNTSEYIKDNTIDITVFCLSLWGVNYLDYIKEAYRITAKRGLLYICEPNDKFNKDELISSIKEIGFNKINETIRGKFTYYTFMKN